MKYETYRLKEFLSLMSLSVHTLGHKTFYCMALIIESSKSCDANSMPLDTVGIEYVQHISA